METWHHRHLHHQSRLSNWDDVGKHFSMLLFADVWFFYINMLILICFFFTPKNIEKASGDWKTLSFTPSSGEIQARVGYVGAGVIVSLLFLLLLGVIWLMAWLAGLACVLPNDDWISLSLVWLVLLLILGSSIDDGNTEIAEGKQLHPLDAGGGIQFDCIHLQLNHHISF